MRNLRLPHINWYDPKVLFKSSSYLTRKRGSRLDQFVIVILSIHVLPANKQDPDAAVC